MIKTQLGTDTVTPLKSLGYMKKTAKKVGARPEDIKAPSATLGQIAILLFSTGVSHVKCVCLCVCIRT